MDVSGVTAAGALQNGGVIEQANQQSTLTMNDFFTLMAAQLQYQDPTSPTDTSQYLGQLAEFGVLQGITEMNTVLQFEQAAGVVGKTVSYQQYDQTTGVTAGGSGVVQEVDLSSSAPTCRVGDAWVPLSDIVSISAGAGTAAQGAAAADKSPAV